MGSVENPTDPPEPIPMPEDDSKQSRAPSLFESPEMTPTKPPTLAEVWADLEVMRVTHLNSRPPRTDGKPHRRVGPRKIGGHRRNLSARLADHGPENVKAVAHWLWHSPNTWAVGLRENPAWQYASVLRSGNFERILSIVEQGEPEAPTQATKTVGGVDAAWGRLEKALKVHRARPPYGVDGWRFSDNDKIESAYKAGMKAAAERKDTNAAWQALWDTAHAAEHVRKWQRVRFQKAYRATIMAQRQAA